MTSALLPRARLAFACAACFAATALAADPPADDRSTPGSAAPSTGVTVPPPSAPQPEPASSAAKKAGSLSGPAASECAALRQEYAKSQACFAPYRLANGGLKPEAASRCREVANPAPKCGSEVVDPK